ncbi:hypothetical protein IMSHALPRED_009315 [Imshaugia aleurites]|uniref:C2H2-type domain-containing protein n=1 Tax=Imshaugia aleurites TaxID=172621 RepID=A0A8H3ESW7_9LECA|nr:hypothetical protein IMSHALPRED_009315 [Imshaugia aleurites]
MTMTMDQRNNHLGGINFDHMQPYGGSPQFTNPWPSNQSASHAPQLFPSSMGNSNAGFEALKQEQSLRSTSSPMPYSSVPASAPSMTATNGYPSYATSNLLDMSQDLLKPEFPRSSYEQGYSAAPSSVSAYAPTSTPYVSSYSTLAQPQQPDEMRRLSHSSSVSSSSQSQPSYTDALDASRGMVALSQDLTTPRNIYGSRSDRASSNDGYGFPSTHSSHSSISEGSYNPSYYSGSVASSVSDYGSNSDMESVNSRTLPRPSGLVGNNALPAPQSMMSQFNSKVSSSTQKKHKCKICDKRFTRPSSLQTHMYSHTGEKPYACETEGCGRHFSVVSNLRRHRKVHKSDRASDHGSPEGSWTSEK